MSYVPTRLLFKPETVLAAILVALSLSARGAEASPSVAPRPQTQTVTYKSGADTVSATLALPTGAGPFPAILVIHEWWGLTDWVRSQARRLANQGYVVLAIDLYRGKSTSRSETAHELMRGLPTDRVATDLHAAIQYLKGRRDVNPRKLGAVGWCMGGGYALDAALSHPEIGPAVICYGRVTTSAVEAARLTGPILGIFGAEDNGLPEETLRTFESNAKAAGKDVQIEIYKGAGHAFMNPGNPWSGYRPKQTLDAWKKIEVFLAKSLKAASYP